MVEWWLCVCLCVCVAVCVCVCFCVCVCVCWRTCPKTQQTLVHIGCCCCCIQDAAAAVLCIQDSRHLCWRTKPIHIVVEVIRTGSPRNRENVAAVLWSLCTGDPLQLKLAKEHGAEAALQELSENGTDRAKIKAGSILEHHLDMVISSRRFLKNVIEMDDSDACEDLENRVYYGCQI